MVFDLESVTVYIWKHSTFLNAIPILVKIKCFRFDAFHDTVQKYVLYHMSLLQVNLDSDTKAKTTTNVENPTREAFIPAQHKIQALMAKDSYPRFIESEFYQILLENVSKA